MSGPLLVPYNGVRPRLDRTVFCAPGSCIVGDVEIGADSSIWFNVVVRGDVNYVRIGERTNIQDGTIIHVSSKDLPTIVGSDVTVGHMAVLHACTIESGAFVGMSATVLDGAVVEGGAMVAAGALVTPGKRVPSGEIWAGSPAKRLRDLSAEERGDLGDAAARYCELALNYRRSLPAVQAR